MPCDDSRAPHIAIHGACQNNLRNLSLDLPLNRLLVVTGVSGSGKSSLVFDTLYAEGQRRYVETFSPYARQFLERMDKPRVERIDGVPPAIAIDQSGQVRTSRSTVGTMTELADYLKLLYARAARLHCRVCGKPVRRDTPAEIAADLARRSDAANDPRLAVCFPLAVPANFTAEEVTALLAAQGYTRVHARQKGGQGDVLQVVQDRFRFSSADPARVAEALEAALQRGQGHLTVFAGEAENAEAWPYSAGLHCAECGIAYSDPTPGLFSFNSPIGACETCRGFGRVIGVDFGLVVPDESKTLAEGAVKPWQTQSFRECQDDLIRMAAKDGVAVDVPFRDLPPEHRRWALEGDDKWKSWDASWPRYWYGARHFFDWLESKSYKMHIRVLLSRYRSYTECPACHGARLKPDALLWRLPLDGSDERSMPIHELMALSASKLRECFANLNLPTLADEAGALVLGEIRSRLDYLADVGLGYLTLDRQSRTLSGGEVQRINLTGALGTALVNTLFVLDEPSVGLHPRDVGRIVKTMARLRDAGNTLVVVEHDPQVMLAADELLEIGPGAGERGGELVARGTPQEIAAHQRSVTGPWLSGGKSIAGIRHAQPVDAQTPRLTLIEAREHNLRSLTAAFPLRRLVCLTGVSGSGKSTLIGDVLYPALARHFGQSVDASGGTFERIDGLEFLSGVVMVDQSPIGKSSRSNPVSYVGAWDAIRQLFAALPEAKQRGYGPGAFSFNAGHGRCPTCSGSGFEHVEMQFLSDVWLRCPDCEGKRYRPEVLELRWREKSVADVLDMTVSEALRFFAEEPNVLAALAPLSDVGLGYLRLGQPVPTLSGGEAQRLKLAGHLTGGKRGGKSVERQGGHAESGLLFLFDEPTTGLHFEDVAVLLKAFDKLLASGHSLIVIEHHLDLIAAADWIIDLGPEGGEEGGQLVAEGSPQTLADHPTSHTGAALREYAAAIERNRKAVRQVAEAPAAPWRVQPPQAIDIFHAREHNLKNISVRVPRQRLTVVTGLSGSGKSTLAFDIIFGEGQRRYLESLNAYARQFVQPARRPEVDGIVGIPPTVAIEQRTSRGGYKSTVSTLTEIAPFLRLLYAKLGIQHCPDCGSAVRPQSFEAIVAQVMKEFREASIEILAPLVTGRKGLYNELAKWAKSKGIEQLRVDGIYLPTGKWPRLDRYKEHDIELPVGMVVVRPENEALLRDFVREALGHGKGVLKTLKLGEAGSVPTVFSTQRACPSCGTGFPEPDPKLFSWNARHGWCPKCFGTGLKTAARIEDPDQLDLGNVDGLIHHGETCPACMGARLNPVGRAVLFREKPLHELASLTVERASAFFETLETDEREAGIARDLLNEIRSRLAFLRRVGLGYLALDRSAPTLSGGEAQRIRLAAQLGSNLRGVCYVLDEPTIGLHPRDNRLLLDTLEALRDRGNTLVVVEHDVETIHRADHIIDLGPGAGTRGGEIVATGTLDEIIAAPASVTGQRLRAPMAHPARSRRPVGEAHPVLQVEGASLHNLKNISVRIPLARLSVVSGVSGSGKSTLARDVLHASLRALLGDPETARARRRGADVQAIPLGGSAPVGCREIVGWQHVGRVLEVDQTPIGKTPRSCPATYVGFWDAVRKLFADTLEARSHGWNAGRFSFNTGAGRCPVCEGAGQTTVEMNFLPDVKTLCEACGGARFNPETLLVRWRGKSAAEVLAMEIDEAAEFFAAHPSIAHPLQLLKEVGLGYLTLGQPSPTLSGGEAQRIKLVTELAKVRPVPGGDIAQGMPLPPNRHTLYVLDEPTVGLHMADVEKLIHVLHRLTEAGHTVLVIEHDLDVIAEADWLIDLGHEGGERGGELVAEGVPEKIMRTTASYTGRYLAEFLRARNDVCPSD
ncbi:MAG: excinuclease ABC subunit UvrA [Azoarcus sp.]|jgi:excinuclease ABC subunit A|nr:excinuclease ABC subunit UvrA [Azoarcus sp.]